MAGGRRLVSLICALLLAAACASTDEGVDQVFGWGENASGAAGTSAAGRSKGGAAGIGGSGRSGSAAAGGSSSGSLPGVGGNSGPLATSPPALVGKTGRGVTNDTIKLGVFISKNLQNAFLLVGVAGAAGATQTNNEERYLTDILLKELNARGGIAGRKIEPVYYEYDATNADGSWSAQAQAGCAAFTEDNEVFAVLAGTVGGNDVLLSCLAKKGVPLIQQHHWPYDDTYYSQYRGMLYQPSRIRPERWVPAYIDGLHAEGFFKNAKIGLMRFDDPPFTRMANNIRKELAGHGLKLTDEAVLNTPSGVGDFGGLGSQISNAVLSFRSKGVTHIIFAEYAGIVPFLYVTIAENQKYRAKLGFSTVNIPATVNSQAEKAQMAGSVAISWIPGFDVSGDQDKRNNPALLQCKDTFKKAGFDVWVGLYMGSHCESWYFAKHAVERMTEFTAPGLQRAIEGLGTSFDSPFAMSTRFGPGLYDGGATWRAAHHQDACDCFVYTGPPQAAP